MAKRAILSPAGVMKLKRETEFACANSRGDSGFVRDCEIRVHIRTEELARALRRGNAHKARRAIRRLLAIKESAGRLRRDIERVRREFRA